MVHLLLNDPNRGPKLAGCLLLGGVVGAVVFLSLLFHLAFQPWDLERNGVATRGAGGDCGVLFGDTYLISVNGRTYDGCVQGNMKCAGEPIEVLYDPSNPQRCRARATASHPGYYELSNLLGSLGAVLLGILALVWHANGGIYAVHSGKRGRTWFYWAMSIFALGSSVGMMCVNLVARGVLSW